MGTSLSGTDNAKIQKTVTKARNVSGKFKLLKLRGKDYRLTIFPTVRTRNLFRVPPGDLLLNRSLEQNDYRPRLLYLHGAHLLGGYAVPAPVEFPVIGRCPARRRVRLNGMVACIDAYRPLSMERASLPMALVATYLNGGSKDSLSASQSPTPSPCGSRSADRSIEASSRRCRSAGIRENRS